jgi:hypothetical protein
MLKFFVLLAVMLFSVGCATEGIPYWLDKYPGSTAAQRAKCLKVAEAAYQAQYAEPNDVGSKDLAMGKAWHKCMG